MDQANAVRPSEVLDWKKLESYLRNALPELDGKMEVAQFHGGHANLTYLLTFGNQELVLRRPPFGKIAPGAHDMKREYNVLSKLYKHFPQAPRAWHLCMDEDVIGARFVIIERRNGVVIRNKLPDIFKHFENVAERLTEAMLKAEAALHKVDVAAAGLSELGRPEGYMQRQLAGWAKRWTLSKTEENSAMEAVHQKLSADVPEPQAVSVIHNDIKFDNCQFQPDNPDEATSIFDWDMSTLGDPLADFGVTLSYWPDDYAKQFANLPVILKGDFPPKSFLIDKYQQYTGFNIDKIAWYESFSYWKLAIVSQQLYKRFVDGATKDKRMAMFGESTKSLAQIAKHVGEGI